MVNRIAAATLILAFTILAFTAAAQTSPSSDKPAQAPKYEWAKTPVKSGEFVHLQDRPASIYIRNGYVSASGVWVDKERKNPPAGPSVSNITCVRSDGNCEEDQAMIVGFGDGTFTLTADHAEYRIDRWNEQEIVAKGQPTGICKVLNVLRIDLKLKKVYALQTLSEPVNERLPKLSRDICSAGGSNWELHEDTPFSSSPDAKTVVDKQN
jgi:hypothetical protein